MSVCLQTILIFLFLICSLWAVSVISAGAEDSEGQSRNLSLAGNVRGYSLALLPLLITRASGRAGGASLGDTEI